MQEIFKGAEAVIFKDKDKIIKKRLRKSYRLKEIDDVLRKQRTRREAKILDKLQGTNAPKLISSDDKETIEMEFLDGNRLVDYLNKNNAQKLMIAVGEIAAILHNQNIIHGDLTTSNMIQTKHCVHFIDFGLSFTSTKIEDKAVDIHLLLEALEAKHFDVFENAVKYFKQGYKNCKEFEKVMDRLEKVEERGRYKKKGGFE